MALVVVGFGYNKSSDSPVGVLFYMTNYLRCVCFFKHSVMSRMVYIWSEWATLITWLNSKTNYVNIDWVTENWTFCKFLLIDFSFKQTWFINSAIQFKWSISCWTAGTIINDSIATLFNCNWII